MVKQWLSIDEASRLFKVSQTTIRRLITGINDKSIVIRESTHKKAKLLINVDFLKSKFPGLTIDQSMNDSDRPVVNQTVNQVVNQLEKRLEDKDRHIEDLQRQLDTLNERFKENQVLMLNMQKLLTSGRPTTRVLVVSQRNHVKKDGGKSSLLSLKFTFDREPVLTL